MNEKFKILIIEPYLGGSHKQWVMQLQQYSKHDIEIIGLPARHWKWRMEGAVLGLMDQVQSLSYKPDLFITTSMLDVPFFKSTLPDAFCNVPIIHYMHENQFAYPKSEMDNDKEMQRDFHYGFIQYKSCIVADSVCFNSRYHLDTFFKEVGKLLQKLPDYTNDKLLQDTISKSTVLPIGIDILESNLTRAKNNNPTFLWNHRWEYDKNPELFFNTLIQLKSNNIDFDVIVLGEGGKNYPKIFDSAKSELADHILHWGHVESNADYLNWVQKADFILMTSIQEYFGISLMEAVANGVIPILPNRLVYPEHFDPIEFDVLFYNNAQELFDKILFLIRNTLEQNLKSRIKSIAETYLWSNQIKTYEQLFKSLVD